MHSTFSASTTVYEPEEGPAEPETRCSIAYMGADKSLVRPWKETNYSHQDFNTVPIITAYKQQEYIPVVCLGRCSLLPFRVGLRTYQHPRKTQFVFRLISELNAEKHKHTHFFKLRQSGSRSDSAQDASVNGRSRHHCLHCTVMPWNRQNLPGRHTVSTPKH